MNELNTLLDNITGKWSQTLIAQPRRQILRGAYEDIVTRKVFDDVATELAKPGIDDKLDQVGLKKGSVQLEMKMGKLRQLWEKFWSSAKPKWLIRLLGWINKLLGSLVSVIPVGEVIRELKDACEEEVKDLLDD